MYKKTVYKRDNNHTASKKWVGICTSLQVTAPVPN